MAATLTVGACSSLTALVLSINSIGPAGAAALAEAFAAGSCPRAGLSLPSLGIGNNIPAAAEQAVTAALAAAPARHAERRTVAARQRLALACVAFAPEPLPGRLDPYALLRAHVFLPPGRLAPVVVVTRQAAEHEAAQQGGRRRILRLGRCGLRQGADDDSSSSGDDQHAVPAA
eukprot:SAG22_NODE_401_length_11080_cov_18.258082_9_plen_174_part_00